MSITAAADGSALGNPGPAGWAWYIDENTWRAGGWPHGTNNMGELKAVLDLLEATAVDADQHLLVLCDSQYVINSITKWMPGWKRKGWRKKDGKPVLNVELLQAIDRALAGRSVELEWVKRHSGHALHDAADRRANPAVPADAPDFEQITAREQVLLTDALRSDPPSAAELLHPSFTEVGASGRRLDREEILAHLAPLDRVEAAEFVADEIAPGVVLLRYVTTSPTRSVERTSVWVQEDGRWLLRHHQGTPVGHDH